MIGIGAAGVLFGATRYFAKGTPRTMNKEWQEATNEYLKVSMRMPEFVVLRHVWQTFGDEGQIEHLSPGITPQKSSLTRFLCTGEQDRAHHLGRQPRLQGPRRCPKSSSTKGVIYTTLIEANIDGGAVKLNVGVQLSHALSKSHFIALNCRTAFRSGARENLYLTTFQLQHLPLYKEAIKAKRRLYHSGPFLLSVLVSSTTGFSRKLPMHLYQNARPVRSLK